MKVRLNFATEPLENNRRYLLTVTLAGLIAFASFASLSATAFSLWRANRALREEITQLERDMREFRTERHNLEESFKQPATRTLMERSAFLNSLIEQRSFPWTRIFSALERRLPEGVRVVTLAPRMQDGRVLLRLVFGAADDAAKLRFLRTLESAPDFSMVQVVSETRPKSGETSDVVQVEITALYVPTDRLQQVEATDEKEAPPETKKGVPAPAPRKSTLPPAPSKAGKSAPSTTARRLP